MKEIVSMDNEAQFGKRVYTLNLRQAIDAGLICDYKLRVVCLNAKDALLNIETLAHTWELDTGLDLSRSALDLPDKKDYNDKGHALEYANALALKSMMEGKVKKLTFHMDCRLGVCTKSLIFLILIKILLGTWTRGEKQNEITSALEQFGIEALLSFATR